jgi:hypothetical protein
MPGKIDSLNRMCYDVDFAIKSINANKVINEGGTLFDSIPKEDRADGGLWIGWHFT